MDDLSWADVRQALETAAAELNKVDLAWTADANTVAEAALIVDTSSRGRLRNLRDPERLEELRHAIALVEWLLDDIADADNPL
jgi:hypothetical protein